MKTDAYAEAEEQNSIYSLWLRVEFDESSMDSWGTLVDSMMPDNLVLNRYDEMQPHLQRIQPKLGCRSKGSVDTD